MAPFADIVFGLAFLSEVNERTQMDERLDVFEVKLVLVNYLLENMQLEGWQSGLMRPTVTRWRSPPR